MTSGVQRGEGLRWAPKALSAFGVTDWTLNQSDADGLRHVASVSVRVHWFGVAVALVEVLYRPHYEAAPFAAYSLLLLLLAGVTAYTHYRLRSDREITWRLILTVCVVDVVTVSGAIAVSNGFSHPFIHLFFYPALAGFAVTFTSFKLNMAWVTLVSAIYVGLSLGVGDGLDIAARDEKALLARVAIMYGLVATVNLVSRFERIRWREAVERERMLQRERVELSQSIHDSSVQFAYLIGLGVDRAKALAGTANAELTAALEETAQLSRSTIWELRHPIDMGRIYEGRELGSALRSHVASFTNITSVPAEVKQTGTEPRLSTEARSLLFSTAHNALTNAYRHAGASKVVIDLEFGDGGIRLSVSDDGVGLPPDYAERGSGFANMGAAVERLGGRLAVERQGPLGGATVTCVAPPQRY